MTDDGSARSRVVLFVRSFDGALAVLSLVAIAVHLVLVPTPAPPWSADLPLWVVVLGGGVPLVWQVLRALLRRQAGADLLAATSVVAAVLLDEWLVAAIIVLMMSGGAALEEAATARASATLQALARRSPTVAHRLRGADLSDGVDDVPAERVDVGDVIAVLPHELCPVDGVVIAGHGSMDESYLTGEPYVVPKSVGSTVMSGAVNATAVLTVRATARASDSRYAKIVSVLRHAEEERPPIRRLADRLGGWYTLLALTLGVAGWVVSGEPRRFLAVVVVATPCPLLIGVPVAMIGAISLAAKRGIILRNPAVLEQLDRVETVLFDKTGTLTYGRPVVTEVLVAPGVDAEDLVAAAAAVETYSRHPLASAVVEHARARGLVLPAVGSVTEEPGRGLLGEVEGRRIRLTNRTGAVAVDPRAHAHLPSTTSGLEAVVLLDDRYAATIRFRDQPRSDAVDFIAHLPKHHGIVRRLIVSGDRETEVRHLAGLVGIDDVHAEVSPERKLEIVHHHRAQGPTLFLGDGINDAPAMAAATVGVAFGAGSDVTSEAADAVVLDSSLERVDDLLHIGRRMRRIALQSAVGGIGLSTIGMGLAVAGLLTPVAGAVAQEVIDLLAILNAARVALVRRPLADFAGYTARTDDVGSTPEDDRHAVTKGQP
ncbi:MAG TPA: heavy metal translocating P-type ATPase [Actinomycetales bacterium]|nr:heavy metal translocating P-type ATPase [Actinomycetales bacterium]